MSEYLKECISWLDAGIRNSYDRPALLEAAELAREQACLAEAALARKDETIDALQEQVDHMLATAKRRDERIKKLEAVLFWQTGLDHPLTCGNDECPGYFLNITHRELYMRDGVLKCHYCDYEQEHIPDVVLSALEADDES